MDDNNLIYISYDCFFCLSIVNVPIFPRKWNCTSNWMPKKTNTHTQKTNEGKKTMKCYSISYMKTKTMLNKAQHSIHPVCTSFPRCEPSNEPLLWEKNTNTANENKTTQQDRERETLVDKLEFFRVYSFSGRSFMNTDQELLQGLGTKWRICNLIVMPWERTRKKHTTVTWWRSAGTMNIIWQFFNEIVSSIFQRQELCTRNRCDNFAPLLFCRCFALSMCLRRQKMEIANILRCFEYLCHEAFLYYVNY